jgi:hypothetical protein
MHALCNHSACIVQSSPEPSPGCRGGTRARRSPPSAGFDCGEQVDVKVHRVIADEAVEPTRPATGLGLILELNKQPRPGFRTDGSSRVDEYLREQIREEMRR